MMRSMKRVYMVYSRAPRDALIARLQDLGVLHIEEAPLDLQADLDDGPMAEQHQDVENALVKARGILDYFREVDPEVLQLSQDELDAVSGQFDEVASAFREQIESLEGELRSLVSERRKLRDRLSAIDLVKEILDASPDLLDQLPREGRSIVAMLAEDGGRINTDEIQNVLEDQLGDRYRLVSRALSEDRIEILASVEPEFAEAVEEYLEAKGFRHISLPAHVEELSFPDAIRHLQDDRREIPDRLDDINRQLRKLGQEQGRRMMALTWALENRLAQLEAAERFGYTNYAFIVSGWIPDDAFDGFRSTLRHEFPDIVVNEDPSETDHDAVPVSFVQSSWSKPYQLILDIFGTPKHGSIDPVPMISLFFPILFAIIVGDLGYGLVIVALALWARRGFPGLNNQTLKRLPESEAGLGAIRVLLHGGLFSSVAGILFGEVFGIEVGLAFGWHVGDWWPLPRVEHLHGGGYSPASWLLPLVLGLGIAQITIGLLFGVATALRLGDRKHAFAKIGLLLALFGITILIGDLSERVAPLEGAALYGVGLWAIGIPFMAMGGINTLLEMPTPFVHMLSYARVMGFAVAAVMLSVLINQFVSFLAGSVVVLGVVLAAVAAIVLHTFNLVLHVFEGSIQSARLQWVEFFEKFLLEELGGVPYRPFREVDVSAVEKSTRP
mgnify:CR=1 FL=1